MYLSIRWDLVTKSLSPLRGSINLTDHDPRLKASPES